MGLPRSKRLDTRSRAGTVLQAPSKLQGPRLCWALRNLLSEGDDQRFVEGGKQLFISLALTRFNVPVSILQSSCDTLRHSKSTRPPYARWHKIQDQQRRRHAHHIHYEIASISQVDDEPRSNFLMPHHHQSPISCPLHSSTQTTVNREMPDLHTQSAR